MVNIIRADVYRMRKSAGMRNILIGLFLSSLFIALMALLSSSSSFDSLTVRMGDDAAGVEFQQTMDELEDVTVAYTQNAADYGRLMMSENFLVMFFLPVVIIVFGCDFSYRTYRNSLSYESNRTKIYFAKLLLNLLTGIFCMVFLLVVSWLIGGLFFGFSGFSPGYLFDVLMILLLQIPVILSLMSFTQCVSVISKNSGATIATFLIAIIALSALIQLIVNYLNLPTFLYSLDWLSSMAKLADYQQIPVFDVIITEIISLVFFAVTTTVGVIHFRNTDMP